MTIRSTNKNVTCAARATEWTKGADLKLTETSDVILRQAKLWFSAGCAGHVEIRIMLNGSVLLPDPLNNYSDSYVGSDVLFPVYVGKRLHQSDMLTIDYKNSDWSVHTISTQFELQPLAADTSVQMSTAVPARTIPSAAPSGFIPANDRDNMPDYVMQGDKAGRVVDESERAYVGPGEQGLPDFLKMDGDPENKRSGEDPRRRRK